MMLLHNFHHKLWQFFLLFSLFIYAVISKRDVTKYVSFAIWAPIALLFFIIFFAGALPFSNTIISVLIVLLYSFYLVYDLQRLTGRYEQKFSYDEYIIASMDIFIDIAIIFLELLSIFGRRKQ